MGSGPQDQTPARLLQADRDVENPGAAKFDKWKVANPEKLSDQAAVLDFIFHNCQRYHEPEWSRYPVFMLA